jgi:uncharacterized repeat protein (TIGR03847 family)
MTGSESYDLDAPDHFTAGAVGKPGERVFYLQGRQGRQLVTLKCEKEHVSALAEYLAGLLVKLGARETAPSEATLVEPVEPAWDVGAIAIGYDDQHDRILVVANELVEEEGDAGEVVEAEPTRAAEEAAEPRGATARFLLTRAQAAAFVDRGRALIKGGRPTCPMCGQPRDPSGHACPRSNGHVVR